MVGFIWCLMPLSRIFQLYQRHQVLLVEDIRVPGENYRLVTSHWQTLSHNVVSSTLHHEQGSNSQLNKWREADCIGSYKSNYHTIITTKAPTQNEDKQNIILKRWYYMKLLLILIKCLCCIPWVYCMSILVKKYKDVNEHERLANITLSYKPK